MLFSIDNRQQRELWGLSLLSLALLLALSLLPLEWVGAGETFPSRNIVGPFGNWLRATLVGGLGVGALAIPLLCGVGRRAPRGGVGGGGGGAAARVRGGGGGWVASDRRGGEPALRWSLLVGGLAFI